MSARGAVRDRFAHRDQDLDLSVLDVLGMHETCLDEAELLRQHGADQPIEVASSDEPVSRSVATSSLLICPADARPHSSESAAAPRP